MPRAQDGRLGRSAHQHEEDDLMEDEASRHRRGELKHSQHAGRVSPGNQARGYRSDSGGRPAHTVSRKGAGPPRPLGPASPVRAEARPSDAQGHEEIDEEHEFAYATRGSRLADVRAHDEEVVERMVEAMEEAPQSLRHSKDSWQQQTFRDWMHEHYPSVKRKTREFDRLKSLWDSAVTDYEMGAPALEEGRYSRSPGRGDFEQRPHIDSFGARQPGDAVATSGEGHHYGARVDRSVKSRTDVGKTEYSGKYSGGVRHTIVRQGEVDPETGEPKKTTYVSRVGGGNSFYTVEEEEEEEYMVLHVRVPSSVYNPEDAVYDIPMLEKDTIYDLKQKICDEAKLPVVQQKLFSTRVPKGSAGRKREHLRELKQNTWMLEEYGVEEGEVLVVHMATGWKPPWWLLIFTVLELVLVHLDHSVPPRCVDVLDLRTKYGECDRVLRSGAFTCEHDFCPGCDTDHEGFQAHQCDLSCGFCPLPDDPCPATPEAAPCINRLDDQIGSDGHCEMLVRTGAASCARDFCYDCDGETGNQEGMGSGGHQGGKCDLTCSFCDQTPVAPNCTQSVPLYPVKELPDGYLWETPYSSEVLADTIVILVNLLGFIVIARQDHMRQPAGVLQAMEVSAPLAQILNGLAVVGMAAGVMLFSTQELDLWVWGYAFATGIALLWSGTGDDGDAGRGFPSTNFYPAGLAVTSLEMALVLVFIGFDYCPGLVFLTIAYYASSVVIVLSTPPWIRAFFFATQLVLTDGLFFWSSLFGLQFHSWNHTGLPVQLVLLAGMLRLVGSIVWVWNLRVRSGATELDKIHSAYVSIAQHALIGVPGVLLALASMHRIDHRRVTIESGTMCLVVFLAVAPFVAAFSAVCADMKNNAGFSLARMQEHNWRPSWKHEKQSENHHHKHDGKKKNKYGKELPEEPDTHKTVLEAGDFRSPQADGSARSPAGGGGPAGGREKKSRTSPGRVVAMAGAV